VHPLSAAERIPHPTAIPAVPFGIVAGDTTAAEGDFTTLRLITKAGGG